MSPTDFSDEAKSIARRSRLSEGPSPMEGIVTLTLGGRRGTKATMSTLGNQVDWEDQPAATCDSRRSIRSWKSKTAAFRREFELILLPVGSLSASMTCSLCSTGITPLHHYYGAVRP